MSNNSAECNSLFFQSLSHQIQLVKIDLVLDHWNISPSSHPVPIEVLIISIWCGTEVLRHFPAEQFPEVKEPSLFIFRKFFFKDSLALFYDLLCIRELNDISLYHVLLARTSCSTHVELLVLLVLIIGHVMIVYHLVDIVVPLAQFETVNSESVVIFLPHICLGGWVHHNFPLFVDRQLHSVKHVLVVIKEFGLLALSAL